MKRGIVLICLLLIIFINLVSAIRINEVELNPAGDDSGNEWVELYSANDIDITGWKLINGDGDIFNLNRSFDGVYIIEFRSQWLDNKDEKVILKDFEDKIIDKTDVFADSSNNDKTWQFCEEWIFEISTKDDENNCPEEEKVAEEEPEEENDALTEDEEEPEDEIEETKTQKKTTEEAKKIAIAQPTKTDQTGEIIRLGDRKSLEEANANEETLYESSTELIKKYGIYAFCLLLIVIIIVMSFKIRKIKKQNV